MDPFIGEIRAFGFSFAPDGWLACNGQTFQIVEFQALYAVIGNIYGGSGSTFSLPNLTGSAVLNWGQGQGLSPYLPGSTAGDGEIVLTRDQLPTHSHTVQTQAPSSFSDLVASPTNNFVSTLAHSASGHNHLAHRYSNSPAPNAAMFGTTISVEGGSVAHENQQPFLQMLFCICYDGYFPQRP